MAEGTASGGDSVGVLARGPGFPPRYLPARAPLAPCFSPPPPNKTTPRPPAAEGPSGTAAAPTVARPPLEFTGSGVPQETFQPGDPAFPQILAPARTPRPLFSPSITTRSEEWFSPTTGCSRRGAGREATHPRGEERRIDREEPSPLDVGFMGSVVGLWLVGKEEGLGASILQTPGGPQTKREDAGRSARPVQHSAWMLTSIVLAARPHPSPWRASSPPPPPPLSHTVHLQSVFAETTEPDHHPVSTAR